MKAIDYVCKFINKQEQANLIDAESASTIPEASERGNNRNDPVHSHGIVKICSNVV